MMKEERKFNKYKDRGNHHWQEMRTRDIRKFNAFQQARYEWVINSIPYLKGKRVLDIGCGDGSLSYLLAEKGAEVTGIDNEELGISFARENLGEADKGGKLKCEFVVASGYELPFPDESFDFVVNSEVIEHVREPELLLKEAARVLRVGGKLIMTTPHRLTEKPGDVNHVQEFFPEEIKTLTSQYFSEVELKLTHHIFWYGMYTYAFRGFSNRQFGKWLINIFTLWFGWNPFLIDYPNPTKRDIFTQILVMAEKTQ